MVQHRAPYNRSLCIFCLEKPPQCGIICEWEKVCRMSEALIEQFNSLHNSGMFAELDKLRHENRHLRRMVEDSSALLLLTTADSMFEYISKIFLDSFIPQFMSFTIQPPRERAIIQYCYRGMDRIDRRLPDADYFTIKRYFDAGYVSHNFGELCISLGETAFSEELRAAKPQLVFPLRGIGGIYGVAIFGEKVIPTSYTPAEIDYIEHLFKVLSVMIQNDLHYKSSITDQKTGLYTYDYFVNKLDECIAVVQRYKRNAGMMMLDIDFFKAFNDKWGHLAGDKLLVALASAMGAVLRKEDCLCRFGGEEFAILISETDALGLFSVAERIRKTVAETEVTVGGKQASATISIGAFLLSPDEVFDAQRIIERADRALYQAKNSGRNRTVLFPDGLLKRAELHLEQLGKDAVRAD